MPRPHTSRRKTAEAGAPRVTIVAPLSGSLLRAAEPDLSAARDVIRRMHDAGVSVVGFSSGTLAEVAPVATALGLRAPVIVEAFGAITHPTPDGWSLEPCGPPSDDLLDLLRDIEDRSGASLLVYSALRDEEAARLTGLSSDEVRATMAREFSEPFIIEQGALDDVLRAAAEVGLSICSDGTLFYPVSNPSTSLLRALFETRCQVTIGFGTSPIDEEFLSLTDIRVIVPAADGTLDPYLVKRVSDARHAPESGPAGWRWAFENIWPAVADAKTKTPIGSR